MLMENEPAYRALIENGLVSLSDVAGFGARWLRATEKGRTLVHRLTAERNDGTAPKPRARKK